MVLSPIGIGRELPLLRSGPFVNNRPPLCCGHCAGIVSVQVTLLYAVGPEPFGRRCTDSSVCCPQFNPVLLPCRVEANFRIGVDIER